MCPISVGKTLFHVFAGVAFLVIAEEKEIFVIGKVRFSGGYHSLGIFVKDAPCLRDKKSVYTPIEGKEEEEEKN